MFLVPTASELSIIAYLMAKSTDRTELPGGKIVAAAETINP